MDCLVSSNYLGIEPKNCTLFLAGGIANCKDWQKEIILKLNKLDVTIYNPRREFIHENIPINIKEEQMWWECVHLRKANIISFYFSSDSVCPVSLFQLGGTLERNLIEFYQDIVIYCEPEYKKKFNVEFQTKLCRNFFYSQKHNFGFDFFTKICYSYDEFIDVLKIKINENNKI